MSKRVKSIMRAKSTETGKSTGSTAPIRRAKRGVSRANGEATRNRILDAAERLFAEHGYAAVSLRRITAEAGVNVAAVHFHFASKEALFEAIFDRRVRPINDARIERFKEIGGGKALAIEALLGAFIEPHLQLTAASGPGAIALLQFMARATTEPDRSIQSVLLQQFDPVWYEMVRLARRAAPDASEEAVCWGLFFVMGALYFVNPARTWLTHNSNGKCSAGDPKAAIRYLLPFVTGGMTSVLNSDLRKRPASAALARPAVRRKRP